MPSQTAAEQGEAELRILNFKTTWSDFQKPSQTATEGGNAELHILDIKTTQSEFQKPYHGYSGVSNKRTGTFINFLAIFPPVCHYQDQYVYFL